MAAPKTLKFFENKQLRLPHTFWGDVDGPAFYPDTYLSGFQVVSMLSVSRKARGMDKCINFKADDEEVYVMNMDTCLQFWKEKRFLCKLY